LFKGSFKRAAWSGDVRSVSSLACLKEKRDVNQTLIYCKTPSKILKIFNLTVIAMHLNLLHRLKAFVEHSTQTAHATYFENQLAFVNS